MHKKKTLENEHLWLRSVDLSKYPVLDQKTERELFQRVSQGDRSGRDLVILHNLRLVVNIASKRYRVPDGASFSLGDLIQEGMVGLSEAVDRFDLKVGVMFSTYATWWIRKSISELIRERSEIIKNPRNSWKDARAFRRTFEILRQKLSRDPSIDEIAKEMSIEISDASLMMRWTFSIQSLDEVQNDKTGATSYHFLSNDEEPSDEIVEKLDLDTFKSKQLKLLLGCIKEDEKKVIILRFGLDGHGARSYKKIASIMKISRQKVSCLEQRALKRIRLQKEALKHLENIYGPLS